MRADTPFRNRTKELAALEELYQRPGGKMGLMYGRRRVGKSRLLREFTRDKRALFYVATAEISSAQVRRFSEAVSEHFGVRPPEHFDSWADALQRLFNRSVDDGAKRVIILDEFQSIVDQDPSVPSVLRALWDHAGEGSEIMLVLCGSIVSEMERMRDGAEPLYGRFLGLYRIKPFGFSEASMFFPGRNLERRVELYAVLGGMPMYLNLGASYTSTWKLIEEEIMNPNSVLYEEIPLLLSQELREPATYMTILSLVARGLTRTSQVASEMGESATTLSKYFSRLAEMDLLKKEVPVTEKSPEKSKKGSYSIKDNFVRFWFRFLFPYKYLIETGDTDVVMSIVRRDFGTYLGYTGEEVAREAVRVANRAGTLPVRFARIGRYWDRRTEIDICGLDEQDSPYLWGECRWSRNRVGPKDLEELEEKVAGIREYADRNKIFLLCSRSGFTERLIKVAGDREDVLLWDAETIDSILSDGH